MGAPGYTVFCRNGHIVKHVEHHYIDDTTIEKCKYCGSKEFYTEIEWGDPDYGNSIIPTDPLHNDISFIEDPTPMGLGVELIEGSIRVKVYDVSKVTDWKNYHL